ncbi:hypothetical protein JHN63_20500 [Streptomyces sp. MBT65]|uniref:hypothetical protein n=1 Tax=unclassified Streptomyces TaxID=2593676 RepID=UPI00190BD5B1|nr:MULTISPECIES: hypothetical protein [unclassified Streptomyces]MBK3576156.1 hypothetical protein [Streptomyces sp. MBT65]MBK3637216.1 hypothetical protein [Streptomyces sp. MBT97]
MTGDVIPRDQAIANFRRVLDAARRRRDRDRAAGRLDSGTELILRRLERDRRQQAPAVEQQRTAA